MPLPMSTPKRDGSVISSTLMPASLMAILDAAMEKCVYRAWRLASLRSIQSVTSKPSFSSSTMAPTWHGYSSAHSGSRAMPDSPRRSFWKWSSDPSPRLVTDPMPVMTIFFFGAASADMDSDEELWGDREGHG